MQAVYIRNSGQSILYEKEFREKLACDFDNAARNGAHVIQHVSIVGVAAPLFFGFNGADEDSTRLRHIMNYVSAKGGVIAPDFTLDAVSFTNGRDFLKETGQTDMILMSCIPKDKTAARADVKITSEKLAQLQAQNPQSDPVVIGGLAGALSENHNRISWQSRIKQSGASLCVTFGGQDEISSQYLMQDGYEQTLPTPNRRIVGWTNRYETAEEFYQKPNDYPMLWLGMLTKKGLKLAL